MNIDINKARDVFVAALGRIPPSEWDAFLIERCGADVELRLHVQHLLQIHVEAGSFLDAPAAGFPSLAGDEGPELTRPGASSAQSIPEAPGTMIGRYKLVEQVGEGGMGAVWMAQQTEPVKRLVALKLIKAGMDSKQV